MIKGSWQIVQWCPDLVAREWLNIGVGFKCDGGQFFKWLDDYLKVGELYGLQTSQHCKRIIELTADFFEKGCYDFSPQIQLIDVGFQKCESIDAALSDSYKRVVTLGGICD